MYFENI